jgi:hypothetical protein
MRIRRCWFSKLILLSLIDASRSYSPPANFADIRAGSDPVFLRLGANKKRLG